MDNLNLKKIPNPSLSTPTDAGKKLDTYFNKQVKTTGMTIKENIVLNEKEESLKKKIFKLDKMETLVHTDENLSKIFSQMKDDAAELYGYHWNETILNMIFNDYVLNSPKYLQKYKNTRAKTKTRRGEEGIAQLQNDIDKEKDVKSGVEVRKNALLAKDAEMKGSEDKEQVDELFGFGAKTQATPAPFAETSKYDTYFIDIRNKKLLAVVPYKASSEEKQKIMTSFLGNPNYKQLAWMAAFDMGVKGVPDKVSDGTTIDQVKQEINTKYKTVGGYEGIPVMTEEDGEEMDYERPTEPEEDDCIVLSDGNKLTVSCSGNYIGTFVEDEEAFKAIKIWKEKNKYYPNTWFISDHGNASLVDDNGNMIDETTGSASSGSFSSGLDVGDKTYQNETTTSASSGQYSGKAIWSKDHRPAANKPAWKGGTVLEESVIKGDLNYMTDPSSFKHYILRNELYQLLNEDFTAEGFKEDAQVMLKKYLEKSAEIPDSLKDKEAIELLKFRAETGKAFPDNKPQGTILNKQVTEHHLHDRESKIQFIVSKSDDAGYTEEQFDGMSDEEIDDIYQSLESKMGISEEPNFDAAIKADLKNTGNPVHAGESEDELESNDGLFKGKWNNNEEIERGIVESAGLTVDNLTKWAAQNVLNATSNPSASIQQYADENGVSIGSLKQKAKFYASNAQLFPNAPEVKDVMLDLIHAIDEMGVSEAMGTDPEVGEDQYKEEQSTNEYIALENQMKQMSALKNAGKIDELKRFIDSLPMIPISGHAGSPDEFGHRDLEDLGYLKCKYEAYQTGEDDYDHELMITNISKKPVARLSNGHINVLEPGEMRESVNKKTLISEKAVSKKQQKFMGMVHAAQKGKLKNPTSAVKKAAESMTDKEAKDFGSTKHKGLPEKKKKSVDEGDGLWANIHAKKERGEKPLKKGEEGYPDKKQWNKLTKENVDEGMFGFGKPEISVDQIVQAVDNFKQSPESEEMKNKFIQSKDYIKQKAGNIMRMPQLKMWLDKNMPQLSNYVSTLWGNWELMRTDKLSETKNKNMIDKNQYKELIKAKLKSSGKLLKNMSDDEKKKFFNEASGEYHQIKESMVDNQSDSMINNQETSIVKSMDSDELNKDGAPAVAASSVGGALEENRDKPEYHNMGSDQGGQQEDAAKFREMLKAKYGVDSVSDLSSTERMDLMKSMKFADDTQAEPVSNNMDMTQFASTDAQKAEYEKNNDSTQMLDYLNKNIGLLKSANDFKKIASQYKQETGQNMQHPMAIYGAIQNMSPDQKVIFGNLENYFKMNMDKAINEERKNSAIINVEKIGDENAKNFKKDMSLEDGISDDTNYPFKKEGIYNEKVWPDPSKFYIEQDPKKVQEFKSSADLEAESLNRSKGIAFANVGNSANEKGNEIPKRNLTKEEGYALAMNRGNGMHDIVYDNKPSEKFEKRMEKDLGKDVYKSRQDKMDYKSNAPMYNKDTQPVASGDKKEGNNKFEKGYNSESITGKYKDEFNKFKLVEFKLADVEIVKTISENAFKLSLDGMGNKYSLVGKKINENVGFEDVTKNNDFYLFENKIFAIEKINVVPEPKVYNKGKVNESSFEKMKHLMNYNGRNYVDTKKSVKF